MTRHETIERSAARGLMRVLVTGGTGFIGSHVVAALLEAHPDVAVRVLTRRVHIARPWGGRVGLVQANVTVPASLGPALAGIDAVVHCVQFAGHPVEDATAGRTWQRIDAWGTRNLVAEAGRAGCRRIVYLSAAGAGGAQPWLAAKADAERAVASSGIPFAILRPTWVYGPGDRRLARLVRAARHFPVLPIVGSGRRRNQPIAVFDLAAITVQAAVAGAAIDGVRIVAGPDTLADDDVARIIQRAVGRRRPLLHLPVGPVRALAGLAFALPGRPSAPGAVDFATAEVTAEPDPPERLFGVVAEPFEPCVRRLVAQGRA